MMSASWLKPCGPNKGNTDYCLKPYIYSTFALHHTIKLTIIMTPDIAKFNFTLANCPTEKQPKPLQNLLRTLLLPT